VPDDTLLRFRELGEELFRLVSLRVEKTRLGLRSGVFRSAFWLWLGLILVVGTALGLAMIVIGLAELLASALGRPWAGDLAAGILVIATVVLVMLAVRWRIRRAGLARLRRKYEKPKPAAADAARPAVQKES
jgi:hypothetical protein